MRRLPEGLSKRELVEFLAREAKAQGKADDPAVLKAFEELSDLQARNPLQFFEPHSEAQHEFMAAATKIVAAFAGNRFGKSTSLTVRALSECCDRECLPPNLAAWKRFDAPAHGWILCPTNDKIYDTMIPALQKWAPKHQLLGGAWKTAWSKERKIVTFANGSSIGFKTYEQDASTLGGAALHFVGYDEPPPKTHRGECWMRLLDHRGYEMYAMTPLKTNTGWIRREIYKNREAPHITVVRGSMHDNTMLPAGEIELTLSEYKDDLWRRAREFGDFVEIGGLIYPDFERCVLKADDPRAVVNRDGSVSFDPAFIRTLDVIVGVDPGIRNAGFTWSGFDADNVMYVFSDGLLQDKIPRDYANAIRAENQRWGLSNVQYVCDPAMRQRNQTNAETVMSALALEGIYCAPGQNDQEAGIGQIRTRMQYGRFFVSPECRGLRDEADDYAGKEPKEGDDDSHLVPIKGNEHRLDSLRYAAMQRFWDPIMEQHAPDRNLGYEPDKAPDMTRFRGQPREAAPMGFLS